MRAGPEVVVQKHPRHWVNWKKHRRKCVACDGQGLLRCEHAPLGTVMCSGCNGRGYVAEWRKEQ